MAEADGVGARLSLTGNLEDLPLLDILQIVSFSKKTGWLSIRTAEGEGAIVFRTGLVVASFAWDRLPMDPRARGLDRDKRELLLRGRIELALDQLIRLREGEFSFSLTDAPPATVAGRSIEEETLSVGIDPQELLLELARGMDEDRRQSTAALDVSFTEAPEAPAAPADDGADAFDEEFPEPAASEAGPFEEPAAELEPAIVARPAGAPAATAGHAILLVDDEDEVRRVLARHFTRFGHQVVEAATPQAAVKRAQKLGKANVPFVLVCDLGMPTSSGASFQGGFEVVKRLARLRLQPPVVMMTDRLSRTLQARARQLGITRVVFKPGLSKLDPTQFETDLEAFAARLRQDLVPQAVAAPVAAPPALAAPARGAGADPSRELATLQQRLRALSTPAEASHIARLVLDAAREFFERGLLFVVKDEQARGVTGFGPTPAEEGLPLLARALSIPLGEPSVFRQVVETGRPFRGALPEGQWADAVLGRIGRFQSAEVAVLPLVTHRETIALLFGDNPGSGRASRRLDSLEVFVNQAGIALENVFLQKKIQALQGREVG
jgi:CheY-like chemotaxis protein